MKKNNLPDFLPTFKFSSTSHDRASNKQASTARTERFPLTNQHHVKHLRNNRRHRNGTTMNHKLTLPVLQARHKRLHNAPIQPASLWLCVFLQNFPLSLPVPVNPSSRVNNNNHNTCAPNHVHLKPQPVKHEA